MFSFLTNAAKYLLGGETVPEPTIKDLAVRLQEAADKSDDVTKELDAEADRDPEGCLYKNGTVTTVTPDYILLDGKYMCETRNVFCSDLEIGEKVLYKAYRQDATSEPIILKVLSRNEENWDSNDIDESLENREIKSDAIKRSLVAKVMRREGRIIFAEPGNVSFDLSKIDSTFVPFVGDWLKLESVVEVDENSGDLGGDILIVDNIRPLRSKLKIGRVSKWDPGVGAGTIDSDIIFNKNSCEPGYVPRVGDKVVTDSIESDQGIHTWRSLTVVPLNQTSNESTPNAVDALHVAEPIVDDLFLNKLDVTITDDLTFNLEIHEKNTLFVTVMNDGFVNQIFLRGCFTTKKAQSQLSLVSPRIDKTFCLRSGRAQPFVFECEAKFVGTSEELFLFNFKGFKIGRKFRIIVNPKIHNRTQDNVENQLSMNNKINRPMTQEDVDDGNYVQGIRPCRPPKFIAVKPGVFRVPKHFWEAILPSVNENSSQIESEIAASEAIPCLQEALSIDNYTTKFHALLYLEEISLTIDLRRYELDSAILRHHKEFLSLQVPGLAEKRPSLIIGDRAIVSFKWDSSGGNLKYEGFVHQVKSSEVFLKFNDRFHNTYNSEECQVSFKSSYSSIGRCHSGINLAKINLGSEILFPSRVVTKEPQIYLDDPDPEEKRNARRHHRSESFSSVCSNTSVTSTSDTSSENHNRNPRISVAERLFQVKSNIPGKEKLATSPKNSSRFLKSETPMKKIQESNEEPASPIVMKLKKRNIVWYNEKLNFHQKEAVRNILRGVARPLPYVIFGPPGTGKTMTVCETVLQILTTIPESRLLIATPSNSSANLIAERLLDSGVLKPGDLVRLVARHCLDDDSIPEKLLPYCATGNLASEHSTVRKNFQPNEIKVNCTMSVLGRHRITVGTCVALGLLHNMGFPRGHFTHILVDEAGQATEPEIMIPLTFVHSSSGQIVLAGDPMQLGPVVNSRLASQFGLGESFLSRLLHLFPYQRDNEGFEYGYDPRLVTKLVMNYRSLPEILELPNSLFYESELRPRVSVNNSPEAQLLRSIADDLPTRSGLPPAIVFHGVNGQNLQDPDSPSWYNPAEATQAYLYLLKLYNRNVSSDDIGIITPYKKQVRQIRDLLFEMDVELPKVGSVEEFQGQERKIIILSAVRSASNLVTEDIKHALGFVASPRRLNVAITRARALLVILGNPELLSQDPYWRSVLIYCIERGCYTGCNFLPSYLEDGIYDEDNYDGESLQ